MLRRGSKGSSHKQTTNSHAKVITKLLDFLDSSIWHLPIETFIEQRSIVFDRQQDDSELYMGIHMEFGGLVDTLLECFCEDTGMKPDQLVAAMQSLEKEKLSSKAKVALEPLIAAQSYSVFVPMMMRKNVELQLQALQMIEFMCGLIPSVLQLEEGETLKGRTEITVSGEDAERYVLISVLKQSKAEYDIHHVGEEDILKMMQASSIAEDRQRLQEAVIAEAKAMADAIEIGEVKAVGSEGNIKEPKSPVGNGTSGSKPPLPPQSSQEEKRMKREESKERERPGTRAPSAKGERRPLTTEKSERRPSMSKTVSSPSSTTSIPSIPSTERRPSTTRPATAKNKKPMTQMSRSSADEEKEEKGGKKGKNDYRSLLSSSSSLNPEELAARAAYLKQQRDRLLILKASEREKRLRDSNTSERPKTAKAARGAMRGQWNAVDSESHEEILAARRALVAKLKAEE